MRTITARLLILIAAFAVLATACSRDDPASGDSDEPTINDDGDVVIEIDGNEIVLTAGLSGFSDCDSLLDHLRTEAADQVGPYGFNSGGWYGPVQARMGVDVAMDGEMGDDATGADFAESTDAGSGAQPAATIAVEGVDFSGTNVQEVGVDEADAIKTDGERVFILAAGQLVVVDVAEREVVATLDVDEGWNPQLFLQGDDLLLISNAWLPVTTFGPVSGATTPTTPAGGDTVDGAAPDEDDAVDAEADFAREADAVELLAPEGDWDEPYGQETSTTRITRISLDGDTPSVLESLVVEGDYVSARAVNGVARIIVRSYPEQNFPFVYPASEAGEEIATQANQTAVAQSTLEDWLPRMSQLDRKGTVVEQGFAAACDQVHAPTEFSGFGVLSVISVPVTGEIDPSTTTAVLAPGNIVYASTESIYVATQTWVDWRVFDEDEDAWERAWDARQTSIHRFVLGGDSAAYTASGDVPGDIRNQFSMSEYDGHLRVVTTTGETWDESSESFLRVLRETEGELVEVGSVGDMGNGEAVQSVRLVGDVGYVVTFRQVDPFYTLDLSDPENPMVVGELKIPGFSSYLHPIGNGRVLGVGSDGTDDGQITGSKVSIFDVTDPANPQEVAVWSAPGGWNDVGWEHRSFLWWEPEQLAVVPLTTYEDGAHWAGAVVLRVDGSTITEVGRIDHIDEDSGRGRTECDVLESSDLPNNEGEFETEFEYMVFDEWAAVLVCEPGDSQTLSGFECYEEDWLMREAEIAGFAIDDDDSLIVCWDNGNRVPGITRSMVLDGDEIWTLSTQWGYLDGGQPARLQVNDMSTLDRLDVINVG